MPVKSKNTIAQRYHTAKTRCVAIWAYISDGIWRDTRDIWWVNLLKTLNIAVRSFLNADIQSRACAMAFRTILAIIPALALLFAIGRGFGFQDMIEREIYNIMPAQREVLSEALKYVDSYLNQTGEGLFVGIGIAFLLYTLISLVSSVEDSFNLVWNVRHGRPIWRKLSDYTAMLLILPVLMICGSGLTLFVSSSLQSLFDFPFMTPLITLLLEGASWVFTWLFFAAAYMLIPNTKVNKANALLAGVVAGTGFRVLQWLFISGQLYVTRYNAIYGSFSLIPLLLIWMQLTWVITMAGALLCYASQNISRFSFTNDVDSISTDYRRQVALAIAAVVIKRFVKAKPAPTEYDISLAYSLPSRLTSDVCDQLVKAHILTLTVIDAKNEVYGLQPAIDPGLITVKYFFDKFDNLGRDDFIQNFDRNFPGVVALGHRIDAALTAAGGDHPISELTITTEEDALDAVKCKDHLRLRHKSKNK